MTLVAGRPLQDVLEEQQLMLEQALAFNRAVSQRLTSAGYLSRSTSPSPIKQRLTEKRQRLEADGVATSPDWASRGSSPQVDRHGSSLSTPLIEAPARSTNTDSHRSLPVIDDEAGANNDHKGSKHKLIATIEDQHEDIMNLLDNKAYNVEDMYKTEGLFQAVARNNVFTYMTLLVIIMNTVWISVDSDLNTHTVLCNADMIFQVVGNFFCFYFFAEIVIRFLAFQRKSDAFRDGWFIFDFFLMLLMAWETWIEVAIYIYSGGHVKGGGPTARRSQVLRVFRILRLTRIARVSRIFRFVPELMVLLRGMIMALRSAIVVLLLQALIVYIYAIVFKLLLDDSDIGPGKFESVPQAMFFLLTQLIVGFDADFFASILGVGSFYYVIFMSYVFVASLTMMNMLVGIICQVMSTVSDLENEEQTANAVQEQIGSLVRMVDADGSGSVSIEEFEGMMSNPVMQKRLQELGVDIEGLEECGEDLFKNRNQLGTRQFLEMVVNLKGSKTATVQDVIDMRKRVSRQFNELVLSLSLNSR